MGDPLKASLKTEDRSYNQQKSKIVQELSMANLQQFFWYGIPVFAVFVALELFLLWRQGRAYSWQEGATSFAIGIGNKLSTTYKLGFSIWVTMLVWEYRAFEVPLVSWWGPVALF